MVSSGSTLAIGIPPTLSTDPDGRIPFPAAKDGLDSKDLPDRGGGRRRKPRPAHGGARRGQLGRIEPGADPETGTPEIEVSYTADSTGTDQLQIQAPLENADQSFRFGAVGGGDTTGDLNGDDDAQQRDRVRIAGQRHLRLR